MSWSLVLEIVELTDEAHTLGPVAALGVAQQRHRDSVESLGQPGCVLGQIERGGRRYRSRRRAG